MGVVQVIKLLTFLYGLRQSPRNWGGTSAKTTKIIGFAATLSGPCVYASGSGASYVILSTYADDVVLIGHSSAVVKNIQGELMSKFSMTD